MKVKYINGISVVVSAFFIQGFCGMTSIPVLEVVVLILALWHCLSLVRKKGDGCLLEARKELLSLITKPVIVGLLLTFFLLALIDVGVNIVGSMVMVERLGWTMEEAMKASWVYAICHTIGLCLGTFFIRREHPIAYLRWHIFMGGRGHVALGLLPLNSHCGLCTHRCHGNALCKYFSLDVFNRFTRRKM